MEQGSSLPDVGNLVTDEISLDQFSATITVKRVVKGASEVQKYLLGRTYRSFFGLVIKNGFKQYGIYEIADRSIVIPTEE